MQTQARQRRGESRERAVALGHMDFQAAAMEEMARLCAVRCLDPRQERDRKVYLATLAATREPARRWQMWAELSLTQAEGYDPPRFPSPPWAA